jgi:hypothetical protein
VLTCPCHLVFTLPLAVALLGGTALGGWITRHQGAMLVVAPLYFIGVLTLAAVLFMGGASRGGLTG